MTRETTVAELATIVGGEVLRGDGRAKLRRVMPVDDAADDAVTFVSKPKFLHHLSSTRAAAVMTAPELLEKGGVALPETLAVIGVKSPYVAFARAAQALAERAPFPRGIHRTAVIDEGAAIGRGVSMGPFVYVAAGATIGEGAVLHAGVHVEAGASVGEGSVLYDHVVVRHGCKIGRGCILHPGVVIGADGFGFAQDAIGADTVHVKIPQVGDVVVEDDVEIGANACVDRAALGTTRIGEGTKIDNLVQVGHNVTIGPRSILVAQSGVAGSSKLGRGVIMGAQSGVSGHLEVGEGALIYGQAGVMNDVPAGAKMAGSPAIPVAEFFKSVVRVSKLEALMERVKKLERVLGGER